MNKTKIVSAAKYGGSSAAIGGAITGIILFIFPQLQEIGEHIATIVIFTVNMALAMSGIISDSE